MGYAVFFLVATAAALLWTAACTAAAARVERGWLRALLAAIGAALPVMAVLPIAAATGWLAFGMRIEANWFPQAVTMLLSLLIGGAWIVRAGLAPNAGGEPPAARWPMIGLFALCGIAKAVTVGVLLILDNAVASQAAYLRLEAAQLMESNLPPVVAESANAAALHLQAGAAIRDDRRLDAEDSPLGTEGDVMREEVTALLARHATTLDTIRRAADRDTCRFTRDWSRPSIDMLLAEIQTMRSEARLLALAARRAAAEGRQADALADVERIQRLGRQAASEPILVSCLVGLALDRLALDTLADVLPWLGAADAPLLDAPAVCDIVSRRIDLLPSLYGEEAFGLTMLADLTDGRLGAEAADLVGQTGAAGIAARLDVGPVFRVFFLPAEVSGYRRLMHRVQQLAARRDEPVDYAASRAEMAAMEREFTAHPPGVFTTLLVPSLDSATQARFRHEAQHRAAEVLVAATRQRLATGVLPLEPAAFTETPAFTIPADPFAAAGTPLRMKRGEAGLAVYSVGRDGDDDGGPGDVVDEHHDDIGLVMPVTVAQP